MKYLITYDLKSPGQSYDDLFEAIESCGDAYHFLQNTWMVESPLSAAQIRDKLEDEVDSNDKIFVCVIGNWASYRMPDAAAWLNGK